MKTTFKKVFDEFDDELMNIDEFNACESIDIDVEKIKTEVLKRIDDKNGKKKFSKKLITLLVAAVILITGTVGAFATGSVQSIFKELFNFTFSGSSVKNRKYSVKIILMIHTLINSINV